MPLLTGKSSVAVLLALLLLSGLGGTAASISVQGCVHLENIAADPVDDSPHDLDHFLPLWQTFPVERASCDVVRTGTESKRVAGRYAQPLSRAPPFVVLKHA